MRSSVLFFSGAALLAFVVIALRADDKPPIRPDTKDPPVDKLEPKELPGSSSITEIEGKDLKQWIDEMRFNEDPSVREKAIRAIMLFGPQATSAVPYLVDRCTDYEASPRVRAVIALTFISIRDQDIHKVVDALAKRLEVDGQGRFEDPQGIVRYHAALALNRFGPDDAKSAIPQLVNATKDWSSFETRRAAVVALRHIARDPKNGPDPRATRALMATLASPGGIPNEKAGDVRLEAIISLAAMGRPADPKLLKDIEQTLLAYIKHKDHRLAIWAHYSQIALLELGDKETDAQLDLIAKYAGNPDVVARIHCATALGQCGPKLKNRVSVLIAMVQKDKDNEVFAAACQAMVNIGEPGGEAIKALKEIAEAKDDVEPKVDPARKAFAKATLDGIELGRKNRQTAEAKDKDDKKEVKKDK